MHRNSHLHACRGRKFDDATVPQRTSRSPDALKKSLYAYLSSKKEPAPLPIQKLPSESQAKDASVSESPSLNATKDPGPAAKAATKPTPIIKPPTSTTPSHNIENETQQKRAQPGSSQTLDKPIAESQPRHAQVSFPSGLKGSPTDGPAGKKTDADAAGGADTVKAGSSTEQLGSHSNEGVPLKLSTEPSRITDAASSPGSTAPSATTPAIHDDSTDTSPDHEGPQYEDEQDTKMEDSHDAAEKQDDAQVSEVVQSSPTKKDGSSTAPNTAENQLLLESMQSGEKTPDDQPKDAKLEPKVSTPPTETKVAAPPTVPAVALKETAQVQTVTEVPDSEDDRMDVDISPTDTTRVEDKILSPREPNLPTESSAAVTKPTPRDPPAAPERAVTRVSSGAMRLKSVSEIVGDSARPLNTSERKNSESQLTPVTSTPVSPKHPGKFSHSRDRSKSQISTVLFGKQPKRNENKSLVHAPKEPMIPTDDYFTPLFLQGFAQSSNWMQPIEKILYHANKTIATPDINLAIQDSQACKILRRVYSLQQQDKWSLRQPKRYPEPPRTTSHWDMVLKEAKWMRTDFREERKWKRALAKNLAHACLEWHHASPEERKAMQVPAFIPPPTTAKDDTTMSGEEAGESHPTPDLIPSGDADSIQNYDELTEDFSETVSPSAIFTLQEDDVVFGLRRTAAAESLLDELPLYGAPLELPKSSLPIPDFDPDAHWKRPALPLSKYVEGQMKLDSQGPPRKKSRYSYSAEDSDDENDSGFVVSHPSRNEPVPPESDEVALFHPEQRHTRDRLHAGHQFRPPSEYNMPGQGFYECRHGSQWTVAEDDELRGLVREFAYNWTLISSLLTTRSIFKSSAERRTPWECFERWIGLEGLPNDLQRTQYFKTYNSRIEAGQRVVNAQNQAAAQASQANGTPMRRRQSVPVRVDRRKAQKHLTMIDAMRKLAKKRETTLQKQQHSASQNAQNKKVNESMAGKPTKTPRDYSILRWERDQALADRMAQYAQRQEANRKVSVLRSRKTFGR